jgi:hypothetical protein
MQRLVIIATALTLAAFAVTGFVDALRDDDVGNAVLFAVLFVGVLFLARLRSQENSVVLRGDLAAWLERTSSVSGETEETLANRAVSRLRAGFNGGSEADE